MSWAVGIRLPFLLLLASSLVGGGAYVYTQHRLAVQETKVALSVVVSKSAEGDHAQVVAGSDLTVDPKTVKVGDVFGPLTVSESDVEWNHDGSLKRIFVQYTGEVIVTGNVTFNDFLGDTVIVLASGETVLPEILGYKYASAIVLSGESVRTLPAGLRTHNVFGEGERMSVVIKNYKHFTPPAGDEPTAFAELVRVVSTGSGAGFAQTAWNGFMAEPLKKDGVYRIAQGPSTDSIRKDFDDSFPPRILYENSSRIYFDVPSGTDNFCPDFLNYLDKQSLRYYTTRVKACSTVSIEKTRPYLVEEVDFSGRNPSLCAINLDTEERVVLYTPAEGESLFAAETGFFGAVDIEALNSNSLRVGVFKRCPDDRCPTTDSRGYGIAEKIRDVIISIP